MKPMDKLRVQMSIMGENWLPCEPQPESVELMSEKGRCYNCKKNKEIIHVWREYVKGGPACGTVIGYNAKICKRCLKIVDEDMYNERYSK